MQIARVPVFSDSGAARLVISAARRRKHIRYSYSHYIKASIIACRMTFTQSDNKLSSSASNAISWFLPKKYDGGYKICDGVYQRFTKFGGAACFPAADFDGN